MKVSVCVQRDEFVAVLFTRRIGSSLLLLPYVIDGFLIWYCVLFVFLLLDRRRCKWPTQSHPILSAAYQPTHMSGTPSDKDSHRYCSPLKTTRQPLLPRPGYTAYRQQACAPRVLFFLRAATTSHPHTATFLLLLLLVLLLRQVCHEDKTNLFTGSLAVQIKAHTSLFAKG